MHLCRDQWSPTPIFKDPKTDRSGKRSARGWLKVIGDEKVGYAVQQFETRPESIEDGAMKMVWRDGEFARRWTFEEVRKCASMHLHTL